MQYNVLQCWIQKIICLTCRQSAWRRRMVKGQNSFCCNYLVQGVGFRTSVVFFEGVGWLGFFCGLCFQAWEERNVRSHVFKWNVWILLDGVVTCVLLTWNKDSHPCFEKERKYLLTQYSHTLKAFDIDPVRIKTCEYCRFSPESEFVPVASGNMSRSISCMWSLIL